MRRTVRTKWHLLFVYWLVIGACVFVFWPWVILGEDPRFNSIEPILLIVTGSLILCQWLLLRPVRRPRAGQRSAIGRWLHAALAGVGVGILSWLAFNVVWETLSAAERAFAVELGTERIAEVYRLAPWAPIPLAAIPATLAFARCSRRTRSIRLSMAIAGLAAAGLLMGALGILHSIAALLGWTDWPSFVALAACVLFFASWAVATVLLLRYTRRRPIDTALSRIGSRLFLGSMIEAVAAVPIDAMMRRRSDCYCGEGTAWTLTICWAVGLVACGPVVFLLPIRRRRRRWLAGRCPSCNYDMAGNQHAERCPECGAGWRPPRERREVDTMSVHHAG